MKIYEITLITKEDIGEKSIKNVLTALDGKILSTSSIGEKQFAYKINKEDRGFYTTVLFEIDPDKVSELNKKLSLTEEIIRFLIVAKKPAQLLEPEEKMLPEIKKIEEPKEIEQPKEIEAPEVIEAPVKVEAPKEEIKEAKDKPKETKKKAVEKVKLEKPAKTKVSTKVTEIEKDTESEEDRLKALDEKLDELLKE